MLSEAGFIWMHPESALTEDSSSPNKSAIPAWSCCAKSSSDMGFSRLASSAPAAAAGGASAGATGSGAAAGAAAGFFASTFKDEKSSSISVGVR